MKEPNEVVLGQSWSVWSPARQQWLLGSVVDRKDTRATIRFDARYEIAGDDKELQVDEHRLLATPSLFRHMQTQLTDIAVEEDNDEPVLIRTGTDMEKFGITRCPVDYFHYKNFRYTNLKDAIAEAERTELRSGNKAGR